MKYKQFFERLNKNIENSKTPKALLFLESQAKNYVKLKTKNTNLSFKKAHNKELINSLKKIKEKRKTLK
ncbi:MAG: hypothetical protein ACP6IY_09640 [Promethearchaeia archaeon]